MLKLLYKAFFLFTRLDVSLDDVKKLVNLNITVRLYEIDKVDCRDGTIHFIPMSCVHHSHEEFVSPDPD